MKLMNDHIKQDAVGDMRHRVTIWKYTPSRNAAGEEILTWAEYATVWAAFEYKTGGSDEVELADRLTARLNATARIRYRADLNEKMRVVFDYKGWDIRSILPDGHKHYLLLELEDFEDDAFDATIAPDLLLDDEGDPLFDDTGDPLLG